MTRAVRAREIRRGEARQVALPPALRAELRARVTEAAVRRDRVVAEAKRQRQATERAAAENFERVREGATAVFEAEKAAVRAEVEERAAEG